MQTVPVRVAGELVIRLEDLPQMAFEQIKGALTIVNEEKEKQATLKTFGWWDLPDTISLWRVESRRGGGTVLCIPRGFGPSLIAGLQGLGLGVELEDHRTKVEATPGYYRPFLMRDYQLEAAVALIISEQGVYKCPAGGGKTVSVLGAIAHANQRAMVVVDKAGLVNQWRVRAHQFYGMPLEEVTKENGAIELVAPLEGERVVGKIGQGVWEERDLTVCLRQTLHERAWQLDATGWWGTWGWTNFDECHHLASDTLQDLGRKVLSFWMNGNSATPAKSPAKAAMVNALVGPIVHETPRERLYEAGVLMKPTVEVLSGDFHAWFHPDHEAKFNSETQRWECEAHGCKKNAKHRHRNNYSSVLKALVEDEARNKRIAQRVLDESRHVHLIASSQLKHLNLIRRELIDLGWPVEKIWMLRGEENARGEDQLIAQAVMKADEAVILSTVAGEGLDIPPIDRVHIPFPMRDQGATIQVVGRGERVWPGKTDAIAIDYREPRVDVLEGQWFERDRTYRMQGYDIVKSASSVVLEKEEAAA